MSHTNPYRITSTISKYTAGEVRGATFEELLTFCRPHDEVVIEGNLMLNQGRDLLNSLLMGTGTPTPLSAANALICVGDSTVTEVRTQTELQATGSYNDTTNVPHKWRKPMESGFPQVVNGALRYKARFISQEANHAWNEFGVSNGGLLFNRKVASPSIGTKTTEDEWVFSVELSFS